MKQEFKRLLQWVRNCPVEASMKIDELKGEIEQQQQEIEKLTRIAAEADEGCEYWKDKYKQMKSKSERYEKVLKQIASHELFTESYFCDLEANELIYKAQEVLEGEE